jgi:hypothetical protein
VPTRGLSRLTSSVFPFSSLEYCEVLNLIPQFAKT